MKLRYRLWIIISLLFAIVCLGIYSFIVGAYEQRMLAGQENLSIAQGQSVVERLKGSYPRFPERTRGYLTSYSDRFDARLLILSDEGEVQHDSYNQLPTGTLVNVPILQHSGSLPVSRFTETHSYGYVQHTLFHLDESRAMGGYLLMIQDVNILYEDIKSFQQLMLLVMGTAFVAIFLICYWVAFWFTKPISEMISHMQQMTPHRRSFTFQYRRNDEIKELVEAIRTMVNQLNHYEEGQRQFLSSSSHELKTPLATMQLITENLPQVRQEKETHREFVGDLAVQIEKMKKIVDQLLEINRIWDQRLQREPLSAQTLQTHIDDHFQHLARSKGITLAYVMEPVTIEVDHHLFLLAVDNLVSNAIRYTPEESEVKLTLKKTDGNSIVFSVCDEGIGINETDLPYLFDPFYRASEAMEWNREGSGLGLTIVKQMVDRHGGKVKVESSLGEGTCFHIVL